MYLDNNSNMLLGPKTMFMFMFVYGWFGFWSFCVEMNNEMMWQKMWRMESFSEPDKNVWGGRH